MATTDFTPEQILAALTEAIRPEYAGGRYERGIAWANCNARRIIATHTADRSEAENLATIEPHLRAWLAQGPDYDSKDYNQGCEYGQRLITEILDGDPSVIVDLLDDAAQRTARLHREVTADTTKATTRTG